MRVDKHRKQHARQMLDITLAVTDKHNSLRLKDELEENLFPLNQRVSARRSANWNNVWELYYVK